MWNPDLADGERTTSAQELARTLRVAGQAIGLALVLIGAYYAWSVIATGLRFAHGSDELEPALEATARQLNLDKATVPAGEEKIPIGRAAAGILLAVWYLVSGWLAIKLVAVGGQLVLGLLAERREFLAAMKEFLVTLRKEGTEGQPRKP